jgi:CHAT domain-containing protein
MKLRHLSVLGIFVFGFAISQPEKINIEREFNKGLAFFNNENPTDESDNRALGHFLKIAVLSPQNQKEAILVRNANEKLGVLYQTQEQFQKAKQYYKNSLSIAHKHQLKDSLSFSSLLYISGLYYYESVYDSCLIYLSKAEGISEKYPKLPESERLYNNKGVLLFESGNFRQSLAYFKKAELLENTDEFSNKNNQALALQFLNQPDSTYKILKYLESKFPNNNELKINLATVLIELNEPQKALSYLKKIEGDSVVFYNTIAKAYFKLKDFVKAQKYLHLTLGLSKSKHPNIGFAHHYLGKIAAMKGSCFEALFHFQSALQNFDYFFKEKNVYRNPKNVSNGFYSYFLLEILGEKAELFGDLYLKTGKQHYLRGAISTYEAFGLITSNISKTYSQEDARLDIIDNIHPKYQGFVKILWEAYRKTGEVKYAQRAFEVSEESKATVLALGINESKIKTSSDIPDSLLLSEQNLHISLAALRKNIENSPSPEKVKQYLAAINEIEIKIGSLNEKLEKFPAYKARKFMDSQHIEVDKLRSFLTQDEALVTYADLGDKAILFCLTKSEFKTYELPNKTLFESEVQRLRSKIINFEGSIEAKSVYQALLGPFEEILEEKKHIVFVGDGVTNGLPLEYLLDNKSKFLVENHAVSYLFSAKFILSASKSATNGHILAFAPFVDPKYGKDFLPNSLSEVRNIGGDKILENSKATKQAFFEIANQYQIIHLATHALADVVSPEKSFVRFSGSEDNKLYLFEFSAGMLKNTQLVFLSACDSYGNSNMQGEGIRGLSRGFYLAGSQSIISSLWKAEDFATAYLTKHFYKHLSEGNSYPEALQKAKLDLLTDPTMVQFRHPKYWSHLIYVGFQKRESNWHANLWIYISLTVLVFFALLQIKKGVLSKLKF